MQMHLEIGPLELNIDARFRDKEREAELERARSKATWISTLAAGIGAATPMMFDWLQRRQEDAGSPFSSPSTGPGCCTSAGRTEDSALSSEDPASADDEK